MRSQRTIGRSVCVKGVGVHTGRTVTATFNPAPEDSGITFMRADLGGGSIPALPASVCSTRRGTTLAAGEASVATVEHLMAALSLLGIDNLAVEMDGEEVPILDGSAAPFVGALKEAGLVELGLPARAYRLKEPIWLSSGDSMLCAFPAEVFSLEVLIDFPHIGAQRAIAVYGSSDLEGELAPARTFALVEEVAALRERGLALGGSLDNALVFGPEGSYSPLRFDNEPARHKLLDMIGDLALLGGMPLAAFIGIKSGHSLHTGMAAAFMERSESVAGY